MEGLTARNEHVVAELEAEEARKINAEQKARQVQQAAKAALRVCEVLLQDPDIQEDRDSFSQPPAGSTVEDLEAEIAAEESKLDYMQVNNPGAIKDYEKRQVEVDRLKDKITETETKLERLERKITQVRENWEPRLDELIAEIDHAFAHNFEMIGCAGSVSVHKDEDFDLWAIEIKVKFR